MPRFRNAIVAGMLLLAAAPGGALAKSSSATVLGAARLTDSAHASNGLERARGGPPRFAGQLGARGVTYKGYQYVVYYTGKDRSIAADEAYGEVMVGRRKLGSTTWELAKVDGHRVRSDDAHNRAAIAISEGDGRIHITFDHHNADWINYANTDVGVADRPEAVAWNDDVFTFRRNFGWTDFRWAVTYPAFVKSGTGDLLLYFRDGGSGNGEMQKVLYDSRTSQWETQISRISTQAGTFRGQESPRGPYLAQGIHVGPDGSLQMSWLFRESVCQSGPTKWAQDIDCNRGIYYAMSRDGGKTWLRTDGTQIADTSKGETIGVDNVGPPVVDVPIGFSPSNPAQTAAIDPVTGQFHLFISHLTKANDKASRRTFHYVRQSDGRWVGKQSSFQMNGGTIAFAGDLLYAFGGERGDASIHVATRAKGFADWQKVALPAAKGVPLGGVAIGGYSTWDLSQLADRKVSLVWHLPTPGQAEGTPSPIWVIDYALPVVK